MNSSPALRQDNGITQAPAEQPLAPLQARMQTPTQQDGSPHIESYEMQVEHELMQDETDAATAAALSAHNAAFEQQQYQQESSHLPDHLERQAPEDTADMVMNQELFGSTSEPNSPPHNLTMGGLPPLPLIPPQTTPTQILYERARLAAQSKASPNSRRSGLPSQRRPWTPEEESALMAGLDRVKGPHWSQILAMFGPGGTINEILKDRNQVQLKDKARNLKLFFLKSGIEVPYYLQFVTGELKTRAPSQAAKQAKLKAQGEGGNEDSSDYDAYDKVKDQDAPNAEMLEELGEIVQQHVEDDENSVSQQHHQHDQSRTHGHIDNNLNSLNGVHGIDGTGSGEHLHSQPLEQNYHHHDEDDDDATTRLAQALLSASSQAEHIQEQAHVQMPEQPHMQIQELAVGIQ